MKGRIVARSVSWLCGRDIYCIASSGRRGDCTWGSPASVFCSEQRLSGRGRHERLHHKDTENRGITTLTTGASVNL